MKIYTKTGDKGETGLLGGIRVSKSHLAIKTCGALDEANSFIGMVRAESLPKDVENLLTRIQHDMFDLGSNIAACLGESKRPPAFPEDRITELEEAIDLFDNELPPLEAFILPSGSRAGSTLHLARAVCRRAERNTVELVDSGIKDTLSNELVYLNRLGDLLFVLARVVNLRSSCPETNWDVGRGSTAE